MAVLRYYDIFTSKMIFYRIFYQQGTERKPLPQAIACGSGFLSELSRRFAAGDGDYLMTLSALRSAKTATKMRKMTPSTSWSSCVVRPIIVRPL